MQKNLYKEIFKVIRLAKINLSHFERSVYELESFRVQILSRFLIFVILAGICVFSEFKNFYYKQNTEFFLNSNVLSFFKFSKIAFFTHFSSQRVTV